MKTEVKINGKMYKVGFPQCTGCENLIITHGTCGYEKDGCEYPNTFKPTIKKEFIERWKPKRNVVYDSIEAGRYSEQFKSDLDALLKQHAIEFAAWVLIKLEDENCPHEKYEDEWYTEFLNNKQ